MVRILSNGEIVRDDDPRVKARKDSNARPRQGQIRHDENEQQYQQQGQYAQGPSIFENVNQRLLNAGVPRWNVMQYTVEPIVSAGFILALLLGGLPGILFAVALFFVCKWSQSGADNINQNQPRGSASGRGPPGGGGGQRLGR